MWGVSALPKRFSPLPHDSPDPLKRLVRARFEHATPCTQKWYAKTTRHRDSLPDRFEHDGHGGAPARRLTRTNEITSKHQWSDLVEDALWGHMQSRLLVPVVFHRSLLLVLCIALNSCQSHKANSEPSIQFTHIPPAAQGGRERVDTISGRVRNARPKQQIVIYAHSGQWWVQPWPDHPFIPIKADSTWSTETHLGFEYAALLVEPDYHPLPTTDVTPTQGGSVALVTIVKGVGTPQLAPTGSLKFSGYDWAVRTIESDKGGTNNLYDPENAWTDASGALHMQIKKTSGQVVVRRNILNSQSRVRHVFGNCT